MKNHEFLSIPFISRSHADLKFVWPTLPELTYYMDRMKESIEKETDVIRQRKKIFILEDYILLEQKIRSL